MRKLAFLLTLCACASVPMARPELGQQARAQEPAAGAALVYLFRPSSMVGSAVAMRVYWDERWEGELARSTFTSLSAAPGQHHLRLGSFGSRDLGGDLRVEAGHVYFVRLSFTLLSGMRMEVLGDEVAARQELTGCALIGPIAERGIEETARYVAGVALGGPQKNALVEAARRALAEGDTPPDLEAAVVRYRSAHSGVSEHQIVQRAVTAMAVALRDPKLPGADRLVVEQPAGGEGAAACRVLGEQVLYQRPTGLTRAAVKRLLADADAAGPASRRVVLDLRGVGDAAELTPWAPLDLAGALISDGSIGAIADARTGDWNRTYLGQGGGPLARARLVVLVDGATAGGAEVVAAAVQDRGRGALLGTRTAGTAVVELAVRAGDAWVRIPVGHWVRPSGKRLEGVSPDPLAAQEASADLSDQACASSTSPGPVLGDPLVRRAVGLLLQSAAEP